MTTQTKMHTNSNHTDIHQDGLLDIFLGLGLLTAGAWMLSDSVYMAGIMPALMLPAWQAARKVTLRRMGIDNTHPKFQANSRLALISTFLMGLLTLTLFAGLYFTFTWKDMGPAARELLGLYMLPGFGVLSAFALGVVGLILGMSRMYAYAAMALLLSASQLLLGLEFPFALMIFGGVVALYGLTLLIHFLRQYPKVESGK